MTELTPTLFESIFFQHIKGLTVCRNDQGIPDRIASGMASFDYQFSDHWMEDCRRKKI